MKRICDLPNEVILLIFVKTSFVAGDLFALSRTCKHFRLLLEQNERSLSKEIAAQKFPVPYRILGFEEGLPSIPNLLLLVHWMREIAAFSSWCNNMRQVLLRGENPVCRGVWLTPLWQEQLQVGLLLYKMLSRSGSVVEKLEQLPGRFHALLRFASIVASDMVRGRFIAILGETTARRMRHFWGSGRAPGDMAPWLETDLCWRAMEIVLFERGCGPFLSMMNRTSPNEWVRRPHPVEESVLEQLRSGRLTPGRHYHLRLDDLCLAYGRVWGGFDFWRSFDPFGLKDSGLSGVNAMREMVKHLPGWMRGEGNLS